MGRLFGTDGVRGIANREVTAEMAFRLGRAATALFGEQQKRPVILIGRDTRISGSMLEAALAAGICSAGGDAILVGVVPTPAVAYLTHKISAQAGVVLSASHNPFDDNGIKFFSNTGYKLPDAVEDKLEEFYRQDQDTLPHPEGEKVGTISYQPLLINLYLDFLTDICKQKLQGIKVVYDCSNGAASVAAPALLQRLGVEAVILHDQPDGININHKCGSTHLDSLQAAVLKYGAQIGIANDGDADRCLVVDEKGQVVDGDQIMAICAERLMKTGQLKDNTLVATVMSNIGLHKAIQAMGGKVAVTAVGDRYVLETMREKGYVLGGEQSGHVIFGAHSTTGDGLLTALQVLLAMKESGQPLSQMAALMTRYPQFLKNIRVGTKEGWATNPVIAAAIAAGEKELGKEGRILVRPSGTEPLIRVMAEGPDQEQLHRIVDQIAGVIQEQQK